MRGLKFVSGLFGIAEAVSHPVRGAWIEITKMSSMVVAAGGRTPSGVRGLKFSSATYGRIKSTSHPVRGAWIEIPLPHPHTSVGANVAPRQGCVD